MHICILWWVLWLVVQNLKYYDYLPKGFTEETQGKCMDSETSQRKSDTVLSMDEWSCTKQIIMIRDYVGS